MRNFKGHFSINLLLHYKKLLLICFGLWKPITWILHNNLFSQTGVALLAINRHTFYFQLTLWVCKHKESCFFQLDFNNQRIVRRKNHHLQSEYELEYSGYPYSLPLQASCICQNRHSLSHRTVDIAGFIPFQLLGSKIWERLWYWFSELNWTCSSLV